MKELIEKIEGYEQMNKKLWIELSEILDVQERALKMAKLIGHMNSELFIIKNDIQCLKETI